MTQVIFDENNENQVIPERVPEVRMPLLNRMVISTGVAKDLKSSNIVLFILMTLFFLASLFVLFYYVFGFGQGRLTPRPLPHGINNISKTG
jgi:hypothetical protein